MMMGTPNRYGFVLNCPIIVVDILGLRDRTWAISSQYRHVEQNADADPGNDMSVAEKVANIVADIYMDTFSYNDFVKDIVDTFTDGERWPPHDGRTTYGYLSEDTAESGFRQELEPNARNFSRHFAALGASTLRARAYFTGDALGGWWSDHVMGDAPRAQEQYSESLMDASFFGLGLLIRDAFDRIADRDEVYSLVLSRLSGDTSISLPGPEARLPCHRE